MHADERLTQLGWRMILQIHDELILEGPAESADEALVIVKRLMSAPFSQPLLVDLVVDGSVCNNWLEGK